MKQSFFSKKEYYAIALTIIFFAAVASASWTEPTGAPGTNNLPPPVHRGATQVKDGSLGVAGFIAQQSAQLFQDNVFWGSLRGGTPADINSTVFFGGTDTFGLSHGVSIQQVGNLSAKNTITTGAVASTENPHLCAATDGTIVFCDEGKGGNDTGSSCPEGKTRLFDGSCGYSVTVACTAGCAFAGDPGLNGTITLVTGIPGYVFSKTNPTGLHDTFAGTPGVHVTLNRTPKEKISVSLTKSGFPVECYPISTSTNMTFTKNTEYIAAPPTADTIAIGLVEGGC